MANEGYESGMGRNEYVNVEDALKRVRGNKTIYIKMLRLFLAAEDFDNLEASLAENDLKKASEVAHSIKGITGNLSFTKLFESSAVLMIKLRDNELDEELLARYRDALAKTRDYVNQIIAEMENGK